MLKNSGLTHIRVFFLFGAILCLTSSCGLFYPSAFENITQQNNKTNNNSPSAPSNLWTWISGSTNAAAGIYGIQGVAAPDNIPGGRNYSASWVDLNGNFWLFGGGGYSSVAGTTSYLNDLWKFDGANWTWIAGSNLGNQSGIYGALTIVSPSNYPGAREGAVCLRDKNGIVWLFGGLGQDAAGASGEMNDLWKFDGVNWTWVSGSSNVSQGGTYGALGSGSAFNVPGARQKAVGWIDQSGVIWIFGGMGNDSTGGYGYLNDLWKFDGINWTWVAGSSVTNQAGIYGSIGVPAAANTPGGRWRAVCWIDSSGKLWLFGGAGFDSAGSAGVLSDLWMFDGTMWIWVSGANVRTNGVYGTMGAASPSNIPPSREDPLGWIDKNNNLWLFGGSYGGNEYGDLWKFDGVNWSWISGTSNLGPVPIYDVKGAASANNFPGGRESSATWIDQSGNLWLFGGIGNYDNQNDLWKYHP